MAQIVSQPGTFCLSSQIDDIVFSSAEEEGTLTLTLSHGGTVLTVMEETLYTDSSGRVTVGSLPSLVETYLREYGTMTMDGAFDDGTATAAIDTVTLLYCAADVGMTAQQWVDSHFLTILTGEKMTAYNREERLYAYGATEVTVAAEVMLPAGDFTTRTVTISAVKTTDGISQFNVSPKRIISAIDLIGGRLLCYTVTAGGRSQEFRLQEEQILPCPSLLFVNSFGCDELLHCNGTLKREGKYTRASARIHGRLRNYKVTEEHKFTANTGWLSDAMADWAEELLRSHEVYLWQDGQRGKEVVITDSKSETNNEDDYMTAYEVTYTYAQRTHNVLTRTAATRIFSEQFDEVYA
ncbi:MAG: hypothetical protein IKQ47_07560 [Prevotella sp.]|nr:hypothetical protein [Prevotella sp.]